MIQDLKDFEKFLKICRKQGIAEVNFSGVAVKFGDLPSKTTEIDESDEIPTDALSDEELAFFHVNKERAL